MKELSTGEIIKSIREDLGLSQRQVEKRAELKPGHLSQIESGKTVGVTSTIIKKIAKALGVPPSQLMDMMSIEDRDIRAFFTNELKYLDDTEKDWLRRSIQMVRERREEREEYQAGEGEK